MISLISRLFVFVHVWWFREDVSDLAQTHQDFKLCKGQISLVDFITTLPAIISQLCFLNFFCKQQFYFYFSSGTLLEMSEEKKNIDASIKTQELRKSQLWVIKINSELITMNTD